MQSKAEYEEWLRKFFEGTFLVEGWNHRVETLVAGIDAPRKRATIEKKLGQLGRLIGKEWAKDYDVRKIDTTALKKWGSFMAERRKRGIEELEEALHTVEAEVKERLGKA